MEGKDEVIRLALSAEEQEKNAAQVRYFAALMWRDYLESGVELCSFDKE